jgi:hypothetical protein
MKLTPRCIAAFAVALLFTAERASAISLGQVDTFQEGSLQNWTNGGFGSPVVNVANGGPAGSGDRYVQISSSGTPGPGGRLTAFNLSQWSGNYIAAGVNTIVVDLLNQSSVQLSIRIAFKAENSPSSPGYLSQPMILPTATGWQRFSISIAPGSLIAVNNPETYNTFFSNAVEMRFIHEVNGTSLNGDFIQAQLGIDNIRAVPEPATTALLAGGLALFGVRAVRRRRSVGALMV